MGAHTGETLSLPKLRVNASAIALPRRAQHPQLAIEVFLVQVSAAEAPVALIGAAPVQQAPVIEQQGRARCQSHCYFVRWIINHVVKYLQCSIKRTHTPARQAEG